MLVAASVPEAQQFLTQTLPDLVVLGAITLATSLLVSTVQESYARGGRSQLVTDEERAFTGTLPRWVELLESP